MKKTLWMFSRTLIVLAAALLLMPLAVAQDQGNNDRYWVGTWTTSPQVVTNDFFGPAIQEVDGATLRQIVHISIGGDTASVRFSNEMGEAPLKIGAARIALSAGGGSIVPGTSRELTFGGMPSITIPPGAPAISDPVSLPLPPLGDVAISIYLPDPTPTSTFHLTGMQTTYLSAYGDFTDEVSFPVSMTSINYYFLTGVSVLAPKRYEAVVAFGDSITDGLASTVDANRRWPDILAARLQSRPSMKNVAVLNNGISANRLLNDYVGQSALRRFDRDVLRQPGVGYVIVLEGINDINFGLLFPDQVATPDMMIAGFSQLIARAHELGLKIYGATITPQGGSFFYNEESEAKREAVNHWIRTSGAFDAVLDFDMVLRDPMNPAQLLPAYNSGDSLHPNDAGYEAMADSIDLKLFK